MLFQPNTDHTLLLMDRNRKWMVWYTTTDPTVWKHALYECKNVRKVVYLYFYIKGKCELSTELQNPKSSQYMFLIKYQSIPLR